ncbi:hypothetical protein LCGC14_2102180, partial [marine sediment metagenome]
TETVTATGQFERSEESESEEEVKKRLKGLGYIS